MGGSDHRVGPRAALRLGADLRRDAVAREAELVSEGWVREDSDRGVYITADARTSLSKDAEGYGMTYLFGRGWVAVSDTKQGLILIEPKADQELA